MPPSPDPLDRYRAKRAAGRTPEPFGRGKTPSTGHLYVFHKHHARYLHWDLRLELDGVLESWAVPKGPSPDPADKRLAMHVEPHPLDYADFEGVIPEGEYGAGPTIVWDRGIWVPVEDPREGLKKGKLLFELRGYKVRGLWTLVHTPRAGENHWLLIKERDALVEEGAGTEAYPDDSIYSGLEVDELPAARERARELAERAAGLGAAEHRLTASEVDVMKATRREEPFDDPDWVFELKYDGYRLVAGRDEDEPVLISRNGNDLTDTFPEVARAVGGLRYEGLVLDGEVVVHDAEGLPSFDRLQRRGRLQNRRDIARAALELPAVYYAFDLLGLEGYDLRELPLVDRKELLRELVPTAGPIRYSEHFPERGRAVYEQVMGMRLEGIVAKKADGRYRGGRSRSWYKIRAVRTGDFVVVGWTEPKGTRTGFGALHLAWYEGDEEPGSEAEETAAAGEAGAAADGPGPLVYAGSVGTGFGEEDLEAIHSVLTDMEIDETPVVGPRTASESAGGSTDGSDPRPGKGAAGDPRSGLPAGDRHHWVRPELVAEVRFKEVTEAGMLRHPAFVRLRDDKPPEDCRRAREDHDGRELPEPPEVQDEPRTVPFTNLDKVFWPAEDAGGESGFTKGDLIRYYEAVSPWLLPYLEDRPLVLTRYPDGIHGKSFYQKDAPPWAPDWIRTVTVWSESSERELDYFVADDVETLLYLANLGTIPLHVWHSRVDDLARPDWCLLDLDPKEAPFEHVVEVALFLHHLLEGIDLAHYVKTTGSTGLHVLVPLGRRMTYEQSRTLGQLLAHVTAAELPEIATVERVVSKRGGRVYVDFLQNRHGQLMAAPFAVRPRPGATVSTPLDWSEVGPDLDLRDYTIETVPERMEALRAASPDVPAEGAGESEEAGASSGDPMRPVLTDAPDLLGALERLHARLEEARGESTGPS